ncbi:MAG: hypothetical protein AAF826_03975 [Pseudomonadota bacterium]
MDELGPVIIGVVLVFVTGAVIYFMDEKREEPDLALPQVSNGQGINLQGID